MNIPQNPIKRDFNSEVEAAVKAVLEDSRFSNPNLGWGTLSVGTGRCSHWVMDDVASEVIRRFKAAGYYAHYNRNVYGDRIELVISKEPSNRDI